ncbi:MAG: hypothetical protein GX184_04165 [Clostridiaceae bacterium]|nr:hypothetical protein [Clostridiaceae bacterium]
MSLRKFVAAATIFFALTTTVSLAKNPYIQKVENTEQKTEQREEQSQDTRKLDPLQVLEKRKEKINKLLKEGKIPKEKAEEKLRKIDRRIEEIKEFQKLPLEKKRERVINNFRHELDKLVRDGAIKPEEAERLMNEVTEKINKWDGSGYPIMQDNMRQIRKPLSY